MPPRRSVAAPRQRTGLPLSPVRSRARRSRVVSLAAGAQRGVRNFRALAVVMHSVGQVLKADVAEHRGRGFVRRDRVRVGDLVAKLGLALLDRDFAQTGEAGRSEFDNATELFVLGSIGKDPEAIGPLRHLGEVGALL